ncbi:MAG: glycosyltransferase [bacterium]
MKQLAAFVSPRPACNANDQPVTVRGKFLFQGDRKFFVKGVTYGPFAPSPEGVPFPERSVVEKDFALMKELGANTFRTFNVPPEWLLDTAETFGLKALIGTPWTQHVCFLESDKLKKEIRWRVGRGVKACRRHPAVMAYLIGNEIPPDVLRWHGPHHVRKFLRELYRTAKDIHPEALVSYANYPSTEYLTVDFTDFAAFNVYLHEEGAFRRYLHHLHVWAGERPLVLTEFGIDSMREGIQAQADILGWQLQASYEMGVAGTVVFSWTDEWFTGGYDVQEWAFGLVDRQRRQKPAYASVKRHYARPISVSLSHYPKVSVVVCAFNAERTMDACLVSLQGLNYPNYEVVVVNDGSTDGTLEIARRYRDVRIIDQENQGLSVARNAGITAARGEIVAFTDSDCTADPDWLTYIVAKMLSSHLSAVGGPNLCPREETLVPACVAVSPGGPTYVLLNDEVAEHIAGCNMAFRRSALLEINGFDALFRAAADDVDLCWRLQNAGYTIGFCPAAVVWHFRRNTIKAYLAQQRGYGKAEALVYFKHPYRFNLLGQARWLGRIYGNLTTHLFSHRPVIYSGVFGRGLFQTLYESPSNLLAYLPLTLEWNLAACLLLAYGLLAGGYLLLGALPLAVSIGWCFGSAMRAPLDPRFRGVRARLLIAVLVYLGPLVRSLSRYRWRIRGVSGVEPIRYERDAQKPEASWLERSLSLVYWSEEGREKESLIQGLMEFLLPRKYFLLPDQGWKPWDLTVYRGIWSKAFIRVITENHGGAKRLLRVKCVFRMTRLSILVLLGYLLLVIGGIALGASGFARVASLVGVLHAAAIFRQNFRLGKTLQHAVEITAKKINLTPPRPTAPGRRS